MDLRGKIYINDNYYITYGRLLMTILITFFQFLGMWCASEWVMTPAMFFLFANAFLGLMPQKILTTEEKESMIKENKNAST